MEKICIGIDNNKDRKTGGIKAKSDALTIAERLGYKIIPLDSDNKKTLGLILRNITQHSNKHLNRINNSILFIQYPFSFNRKQLLSLTDNSKNNKIIFLAHDVDSIRFNKADAKKELEKSILNKASCIISHNPKYTALLRAMGVNVPIVDLGIFDYLIPESEKLSKSNHKNKTVSFVGNLSKSAFLGEWSTLQRSYRIELIGLLEKKQQILFSDSCIWKGSFSPDDVPFQISGAFGLVWDGNSINGCEGKLGEYLKYNNPHKASLYIAAGIPLIVWKDSALADFVIANNIGFTIESLQEIDKICSGISDKEYEEVFKNIKEIQQKVLTGGYLAKALEMAEKIINT